MAEQLVSIHRSRRIPVGGAAKRMRHPPDPTPEHPLIISASELRDFLRCRVKWAWRYQLRLVPKQKPLPLQFGAVGHNIMEGYYRLDPRSVKGMKRVAKGLLQKTTPEDLPVEEHDLIYAMTVGYASWAHDRDAELVMKNVEPERWFDLPLTKDGRIRVRGKIDVAFKQAAFKKTMGCFEHKFKGQIKLDLVDMNLQLSVYLWALRELYPDAKRYIAHYNVLRKQMPGPRVRADLFAREPVERMPEEIDQWKLDAQRASLDMLDGAIYPNPMDSCGWDCDYQTPCMLRGRPDDLAHVFQRDFQPKDSNG